MPRIVAVKVRNWAQQIITFAAMSWSSLIKREVKAKATAVVKLPTAKDFSMIRFFMIAQAYGS